MKLRFAKKMPIKSLLLACLLSIPYHSQANAAAYQDYNNYGYINPARLSLIDTFKITGGLITAFYYTKFRGTNLGVTGTSKSTPTYYSPYGQIVYRLHPQWVIGLDVTDPLLVDNNFKTGNAIGTKSVIFSKDYSPKISFQSQDFALGLGLDVQQITNMELNFVLDNSLLQNKVRGTKLGWNAGFLYKVSPTIKVSGSYYSLVNNKPKGNSQYRGIKTRTNINLPSPAFFSLTYEQNIASDWHVNLTARYVQWRVFQNLIISNTPVGNLVNPVRGHDAWVGSAGVRYQFAEQWAAIAGLEYDQNPQPTSLNSIGAAGNSAWSQGIGIQYMPTKELQFQLIYGGELIKAPINNDTSIGQVKKLIQGFDVSVTYKF
jgi:long-chain fatty acid transport protein